jgi:hypothetical protein
MSTIPTHLDTHELTLQVQALYAQVALHPQAGYHFPVGRQLAERLGTRSGCSTWSPAMPLPRSLASAST